MGGYLRVQRAPVLYLRHLPKVVHARKGSHLAYLFVGANFVYQCQQFIKG
ncbi:MAG: hypothetical protein H6645_12955 [Caldilineaceae bacterium]|nr:hypothetical protein [Caldilineaceae bacterium]